MTQDNSPPPLESGPGERTPETDAAIQMPPQPAPPAQAEQFRMWAVHCPFRKNGSPVLGTMGSTVQPVVVMTMETWKRLCEAVPQLQTTQFEVGMYE